MADPDDGALRAAARIAPLGAHAAPSRAAVPPSVDGAESDEDANPSHLPAFADEATRAAFRGLRVRPSRAGHATSRAPHGQPNP
jgi:hypothetical protein